MRYSSDAPQRGGKAYEGDGIALAFLVALARMAVVRNLRTEISVMSSYDRAPPSTEDLQTRFHEYLKAFPDFDLWIQSGALRSVGGGWFELVKGTLPQEMGKYVTVRMRGGKPQLKPVKLPKRLQALKNSL